MSLQNNPWGDEKTRFFFELTPDGVLDAVEAAGFRCTGRCSPLGSFENRVYEVEIETEGQTLRSPSEKFRIAKFYRPGRWTKEQILEEHEFLLELMEYEIPVIAPLKFEDGTTLKQDPQSGIWFCIFAKVGGRSPDELNDDQLSRIGRLIGRIHNVGATHPSDHRITLSTETYGQSNLQYLLDEKKISAEFEGRFRDVTQRVIEVTQGWFLDAAHQRVHGDCHFNNLLWNDEGPFFLDFDDMVIAPPVQDLWLMIRGQGPEAETEFSKLLEGYEQIRDFDRRTIRLIEPLRALRMIHFSAWIGKRWEDPAFPKAFPYYGTVKYWEDQVYALETSLRMMLSGESPWTTRA